MNNKQKVITYIVGVIAIVLLIGVVPKLKRGSTYDARNLPSEFVTGDDERVIINGGREGFLTFGPYTRMEKGNIKVKIYYETDSNKNWVDVFSNKDEITFGKNLLSNEKNTISFDVEISKSVEDLEIRVHYCGEGNLNVKKIRIETIESKSQVFIKFIYIIIASLIFYALLFKNKKNNEKYQLIICILSIILFEMFFFKRILGNDLLIGDSGDGRLNNLIVEHWFQVFKGNEKFNNLNIFYPITNTISYTDMLFGLSIPYSLFRFFGLNMFLSNKLTLILIHLLGSISLFIFLNKKIKINSIWSLIAIIIFSYSSGFYNRSAHTQMFSLSIIPIFLIFFYNFFALNNNKKKFTSLIISISIFSLILYTSFYTAFFLGIFLMTLGTIYIVITIFIDKKIIINAIKFVQKKILTFIIIIIYAIITIIPFLLLYLPTNKLFGKRLWSEVSMMLPEFIDFFNVSNDNLLLGELFQNSSLQKRDLYNGELAVGFSIVTIILFITVWLFTSKKIKNKEVNISNLQIILYTALPFAVIVSFFLILQIDKVSLWYFIYKFVPGGGAIRAVARYNVFLTLPIAIFIAVCSDMVIKNKKTKSIIGVITLFLVFISNIEKEGIASGWNINSQAELINSVPVPPSDCEVFYITDSSENNRTDYYNYQLDAWMIANVFDLKTINGYSGQLPINWRLYTQVNSKEYENGVFDWVKEHSIKHIYSFDLYKKEWVLQLEDIN